MGDSIRRCPSEDRARNEFKDDLISRAERVIVSDRIVSYLRDASDEGLDLRDDEEGQATPGSARPGLRGDPRFDFGPSLSITRCQTCRKLTFNRGCQHQAAVYCQPCFLSHISSCTTCSGLLSSD